MTTALKLQSGRQDPTIAYIDITVANLTKAGALPAIEVPAGAVVLGGHLAVSEAFDSTTTDTAQFGDPTVANRYLAATTSVHATGCTALVPTGYQYAAPTKLTFAWDYTGAAAATHGKARIVVEYYVAGRAEFSQGLDK